MKTFLRRLRGLTVTALLWAVAWGLAGVMLILYHVARYEDLQRSSELGEIFLTATLFFGLLGAFSGAVFATVLAVLERRRTLDQLALGRVAAWGALGGMALPLFGLVIGVIAALSRPLGNAEWIPFLYMCMMMGGLGALCSTTTLALARRGASMADPG